MPSYNVVDPVVGNQTLQYTVRTLRPGPVTDIFLQLLTDQVSDPETIFQAAIDITYKEACQRNNINAKENDDYVRFSMETDALDQHVWVSDTTKVSSCLNDALLKWDNALQSDPDLSFENKILKMNFQYTFYRLPPNPVAVRGPKRNSHPARVKKARMWNPVTLDALFCMPHLFQIPYLEEGHCFTLAFMVSQCRLYLYKNGRLDEIYESVGEEHPQCKLLTNIYCSVKNTRLEPLWAEIKRLFLPCV